ncbi:hypothetical protein E2C01_006809 [Portunus trituberculatus]|uniref:Uncharacterized protein n=1 Tax=Portunus trituberculatus TaxID=210409 RepID=A0A5B7D0N9_PORTR|nr:hypothetical protein [Portunus trituberculatus]
MGHVKVTLGNVLKRQHYFQRRQRQPITKISTLLSGETGLRTWLIISEAFEDCHGDRAERFRTQVIGSVVISW